jgi:hypothetical protein
MGAMNLPNTLGSLDRHQQRREAGLPTVSVLCGAAGLAVHEARRWAEKVGRPVIPLGDPHFASLLEAWVDRLATGRDLARDALAWFAQQSGRSDSVEELASRVRRMTPCELTAFFDSAPMDASTSAGVACRWLLERWVRGESTVGPVFTARLSEAFAGCDGAEARERVVVALRQMIPPASDPVLLLAWDGEQKATEPAAWLESAAQSLARLALWQPGLTTILAIEADELDGYGRNAPESRAKVLIRAGVIAVGGLGEGEIARRLESEVPGAIARLGGSVRKLASDGASDGLVGLFLDAARAAASPGRPEPEGRDRARSAAERFLFERLASLSATAGLFELNAVLDFRFGPSRAMEVDLFARDLGLVVEVDGYYHFLDADAYRRDRRKDLELQRRGYLVVRVLAEDVVARLEAVLDFILDAVASRGGRNHQQRGEAS